MRRGYPTLKTLALLAALGACSLAIETGPAVQAQTMGTMADEPPCTNTPLAPHCVVQDVVALTEACRPICPPPPQNSTRPTLSGAAVDGGFLTATRGTWTNSPQVYTVEWERCDAIGVGCQVIAGQNDMSYQLRGEDLGKYVRVKVTAANGGGFSMPAYSDPAGPVRAGPPVRQLDPVVAGVPVEDNQLTTTSGTWNGTPPFTYAYQWMRCDPDGTNCGAIAGATGSSYVLTVDDVGAVVKATVTASNAQGSGSAESRPVGPVESTVPRGAPAAEDDTLDDEPGQLVGSWVGIDGEPAVQFESGAITLQQALELSTASGRPPYHCSARVGWKVGELKTVHQEGPDVKQRTVRWSGTTTCTGGQQAAFMSGYSFLNRKSVSGWGRYSTGTTYSHAVTGAIMRARTSGKTLEGPRRGVKQVEWHAKIELPAPYQWVSDEPLGNLSGINEEKSDCDRYVAVADGEPQYLNGLSCLLFGNRFR